MQRNVKNKIWFFTFGLFAGVTIGVVFGVAIKAVLSHINALHISLNKIDTRQDEISQRLDSIEGKISSQSKKTDAFVVSKTVSQKNNNQLFGDNTTAKKDTSGGNHKVVDSMDSIPIANTTRDSNMVIMTNQLVGVSSVAVNNLDSVSVKKSTRQSDSMIASMSQVDQEIAPSSYRIEFWESPLNFKGYKMSKGKLILYGVNSTSQIKLVKWTDEFYFVSGQNAYHLDYTDDFRPFEKVTDKTILKKLSL